MINKMKNVVIYARCSTDEKKQDVEIQLKELRRYCEAFEWNYDEVFEYGSGFKRGNQPKLNKIIEEIRMKHYDILLVYSMDRFSRESPSKINALLDKIVEEYKCRFIALQQNIDSDSEMTWHVVKPLFTYFANKFSKDLGEKVKQGIRRKKELGKYNGGRRSKSVDIAKIRLLRTNGASLRAISEEVNKDKPKGKQISYSTVQRVLQKPS